jgi:hypothetical protein
MRKKSESAERKRKKREFAISLSFWGDVCMYVYKYILLYVCLCLKEVCHEISRVLFWHVWKDLGLYKNL